MSTADAGADAGRGFRWRFAERARRASAAKCQRAGCWYPSRGGLPDRVEKLLPDEVVDELLAGAQGEEEIVGPGGLLSRLTKRLVERAMEVELTDHLGYEPHAEPPGGAGNARNGTTPKTLLTEHGAVRIERPGTGQARSSRRSSASASGALRGLTRRSSRSIPWSFDPGYRSAPGGDLRREGRPGPDQQSHRCGDGRREGMADPAAG